MVCFSAVFRWRCFQLQKVCCVNLVRFCKCCWVGLSESLVSQSSGPFPHQVWFAHPIMAQNGQPFWVGHLSHSVPPVVLVLSFYTVPCPLERATASSLADETIFPRPSTTVYGHLGLQDGVDRGGSRLKLQARFCQVLTQIKSTV